MFAIIAPNDKFDALLSNDIIIVLELFVQVKLAKVKSVQVILFNGVI
jgi:hypothetical protein